MISIKNKSLSFLSFFLSPLLILMNPRSLVIIQSRVIRWNFPFLFFFFGKEKVIYIIFRDPLRDLIREDKNNIKMR